MATTTQSSSPRGRVTDSSRSLSCSHREARTSSALARHRVARHRDLRLPGLRNRETARLFKALCPYCFNMAARTASHTFKTEKRQMLQLRIGGAADPASVTADAGARETKTLHFGERTTSNPKSCIGYITNQLGGFFI